MAKHMYRCETCERAPNKSLADCPLYWEFIDEGTSWLFDEMGCASHSGYYDGAERVIDVIEEFRSEKQRLIEDESDGNFVTHLDAWICETRFLKELRNEVEVDNGST